MSHSLPAFVVALDAGLVLLAGGIALWLRPWRIVGPGGPPALWLATWATMPLLWWLDRYAGVSLMPPMSGASMLVLLAGWPLAVLATLPAALLGAVAGHIGWVDALHHVAWLGIVPATLALAIGAALRRWLPHNVFVYILGRGFFATFAAAAVSAIVPLAMQSLPADVSGSDALIARLLVAFGEASLTGMLTAILVAFRPEWLVTYSDGLYLRAPPA